MKSSTATFAILLCISPILTAQNTFHFTIDPERDKTPISPFIYGANVLHNFPVSGVNNLYPNIPSRRFGGDRVTGYNWESNYSNGGVYVCNQPNDIESCNPNDDALPFFHQLAPGDYQKPGAVLSAFHDVSLANGSYSLLQLPMAGSVANDGNGPVRTAESAPSARWAQVVNDKPGPLSLQPDPNDGKVYVDEEINFLLQKYGMSAGATGVRGYELDNEPDIWYADGNNTGTHPRLFPQPLRVDFFLDRSHALANTIKRMDPSAEVAGPAFANYAGYYNLHGAPDWGGYSGSYPRFVELYLARMKEFEAAEGKRLLDVFTFHWYSQEDGVDDEQNIASDVVQRRLQAPRSLWDDFYVEDSWITKFVTNNQAIRQLPDLQSVIDARYPGTRIGLTEWRFGARNHISGGLADADALGIFGKYRVYFATFFDVLEGYALAAFNLYRNYDGQGSTFGNMSVNASTDNVPGSSVYASLDDRSNLHLIAINKTGDAVNGSFSIAGAPLYGANVDVYHLVDGDPAVRADGAMPLLHNNSFTYSLPALSAMHFVLHRLTAGTDNATAPPAMTLGQNYPNPARNSTQIAYTLRVPAWTALRLYDALGRETARLAEGAAAAGAHTVDVPAAALNPGVYHYTLSAGGESLTRAMIVVK